MEVKWQCNVRATEHYYEIESIVLYLYTRLAKMSFDKIFDLTAGVYFIFFKKSVPIVPGTVLLPGT